MQVDDIGVFIGIDVGKSGHWATALTAAGKRLHDKPLPNDESKLRDLYHRLSSHGSLLVVVDQPATIGALAVAVAQDMGITVAYLPGLSMRRIADLTPGQAKTDRRDAQVIAEAARTMPHTPRQVTTSDEDAAALAMLTGFDLDLARQVNQTANRIRGLYTQTPPRPRGRAGTTARARQRAGGDRHLAHPGSVKQGGAGPDRRQAQGPRRQAPRPLGASDYRCPDQADRHRRGDRRHWRRPAPPGPPAHRPARPAP